MNDDKTLYTKCIKFIEYNAKVSDVNEGLGAHTYY